MVDSFILLYLLAVLEGGTPDNHLNLSRAAFKDVQERSGWKHEYRVVCRSVGLSGIYAIRYLKRYDALGSYEKAIRVYHGGPRGMHKAHTLNDWLRVKAELERIESLGARGWRIP